MQGTLPQPLGDVSSHTRDFGAYGDDPLERKVTAAKEVTGAATTKDLATGTARATKQIPGQIMRTCRL